MKLTIHRGTHEIGGSCVELATATTRIVLDAGLPLVDGNREPFDQRSIRGKSNDQLTAEGILPRVPGLFGEGTPPDAILLTHSHLDHAGLLHLSRPQIPIYASKGTSQMMLAAAVFSRQQELDRDRYREIRAGRAFKIGDFLITPYAVDHSTYASMAFLVEAGGKSLLYSGDLRMHGRKPGMARRLIAEVTPRKVDVLLMEGTHFGSTRLQGISEQQLEEQIIGHVSSARGIVLASFSPIDMDRLVTYYRAARRTGRTFVLDAYAAFVLHLVAKDINVPRPAAASGIRVYFNRAFQQRRIKKIRQILLDARITLPEILEHPEKSLMVFRPSMTDPDFGGQLPARARCLYSYWRGYLKKPEWVRLQQQLTEVGGDFVPAHASGHIYIKDLVEFVRTISPKIIVPIHTFGPGGFTKHLSNVCLLHDGQTLVIE